VREVRARRIDIDQFRREVGVGSVRGDPQPHRDRPGKSVTSQADTGARFARIGAAPETEISPMAN
jgi:hypothetical protein